MASLSAAAEATLPPSEFKLRKILSQSRHDESWRSEQRGSSRPARPLPATPLRCLAVGLGWCVATTTAVAGQAATPLEFPRATGAVASPPAPDDQVSEQASSASPQDADKLESRRHFQSGINLFEDENYLAALAEFEAAYRQYPSASALQNIALCQKELYRYSEARESLTRLVQDHGHELEISERTALERTIVELGSLIGSVRLSVIPMHAEILLDGRSISSADLRTPIVLDVGEHRVSAEAPGFAPMTKHFRVAGGHTEIPVSLRLTETTGTVTITAPNEQTAIAIDGRPVAFAQWTGRLEPGRHFVQVYREGYEPFEDDIEVEIGAHVSVQGVLGDRLDPADRVAGDPNSKARRSLQGFYGLAGASLLVPRGHPLGFVANSDYDPGWSLGLRAGYRLWTPIGIEGQIESSSFSIQGRCANPSPDACSTAMGGYDLHSRRFGAGLRLFSSSETVRLTSVFGGGVVSHDFHDSNHHAPGLDPYMSLEAGVQANWRHTLWEVVATALFDGASSIHLGSYRPYAEANGIQQFGLGLRIGWGEWTPSRPALPPMPTRPAPHPSPAQPLTLKH